MVFLMMVKYMVYCSVMTLSLSACVSSKIGVVYSVPCNLLANKMIKSKVDGGDQLKPEVDFSLKFCEPKLKAYELLRKNIELYDPAGEGMKMDLYSDRVFLRIHRKKCEISALKNLHGRVGEDYLSAKVRTYDRHLFRKAINLGLSIPDEKIKGPYKAQLINSSTDLEKYCKALE